MVGQVEANNRLQLTALRAAAEPERYATLTVLAA
jgi:hypothetical protein